MPLAFAQTGESKLIVAIRGKDETKQFLEKLGFVIGSKVTVVSEIAGNLIVNIKDSRVAISREMASRILV